MRARPAPYVSLSLAIATDVHPSSLNVWVSAAAWILSRGTMRV